MTSLIAISNEKHKNSTFRPSESLTFFKNQNLCEILIAECPLIAAQSPIVFVKNETQELLTCSLLGLLPQQNVFIESDGSWKADYIPALLRTHPFSFVKADDGKHVLCVNNSQEIFSETGSTEGVKLFNLDGTQSTHLTNIVNFLGSIEKERVRMNANLAVLKSLDIFEEWDINLKHAEKEQKLRGLWKINKQKFLSLEKNVFYTLKENSLLELIFSHFFSLRHLAKIGKMAEQVSSTDKTEAPSLKDRALNKQKEASALELDSLVKNLLLDD